MSYTTQLGLTDWELEQAKLDELLTAQEADQLFKSWIMAGHSWDSMATLLDYLRHDLRNQEKA